MYIPPPQISEPKNVLIFVFFVLLNALSVSNARLFPTSEVKKRQDKKDSDTPL